MVSEQSGGGMKQAILVTGGAGYIGSHTALYLMQCGYQVIVLDHAQPKFINNQIVYYTADFADRKVLHEIFSTYTIHAVMHCAAFIEVGESVKAPYKYYDNNVVKTMRLLEVMLDHDIKKFIFSSSCAIYGMPQFLPLTEEHPKNPISPYGKNKYMVEMILEDFAHAYGMHYVALRYFNAAGAMLEYGLGELHEPESHIIPLALRAAYAGTPFTVFGSNYPTPDGTCIRDYLHVWDLARAHHAALEYLNQGGASVACNLGTATGFSVYNILQSIENITQLPLLKVIAEPRLGDPSVLIADASKAHQKLDWKPQNSSLDTIITSAHEFYRAQQSQTITHPESVSTCFL